jgi:hypothetical protein
MARVKVRGLSVIDRRTLAARELLAWKAELERDLGGTENLSVQKRTLIEKAARLCLYIDSVDHWILEQPSLIRKRAILPAVMQRQTLVDGLARTLRDLGLERQAKPLPSLAEYLARDESVTEKEPAGEDNSANDE